MENLKEEFRNILLSYRDLNNNKIEPFIIEEIINKSSQSDMEKFINQDISLRHFAIDYIDFGSITVGIISKYGSMNASEILKKHFR